MEKPGGQIGAEGMAWATIEGYSHRWDVSGEKTLEPHVEVRTGRTHGIHMRISVGVQGHTPVPGFSALPKSTRMWDYS